VRQTKDRILFTHIVSQAVHWFRSRTTPLEDETESEEKEVTVQAVWFIASLVFFVAMGAYFALWRGSLRKPQKDLRAGQG
jgi:hypothetical protein